MTIAKIPSAYISKEFLFCLDGQMQFSNVLNGQRGVYYHQPYKCSYNNTLQGIPYDAKFWREKILVNLANYKRFAKKISCPKFSFLNQKYVAIQCMASSPLYTPLQAILVTYQKPSGSTFYFPIGSKINMEVFTARKFA